MILTPTHAQLTGSIIDAAIRLHRDLGPGMFESTYEVLLADELTRRGHHLERQRVVPICYRGRTIEQAFRLDILVDESVIVEVKCTDRNTPLHRRQVLTYLRLMRLQIGLVLNFGLPTMKEGIDRVLNDLALP